MFICHEIQFIASISTHPYQNILIQRKIQQQHIKNFCQTFRPCKNKINDKIDMPSEPSRQLLINHNLINGWSAPDPPQTFPAYQYLSAIHSFCTHSLRQSDIFIQAQRDPGQEDRPGSISNTSSSTLSPFVCPTAGRG